MIGKIRRVALREVWRHEALDLTTWLTDNIDVLNEALDLSLSNPEREQSAGAFNVDIVAEDENGNPVIIENQLEKSDHDHLGKLITYLVALGSKTAIWIVSDPRPEHIASISWLNESSSGSFYLLKLEAIQIDESPPAPLLTTIVSPTEEAKQLGKKKTEIAERHLIRHRFWQQFLDLSKTQATAHANVSPNQTNWISTGSGTRGLSFNQVIRQHEVRAELYIDRGKGCDEENKEIFDLLFSKKQQIEEIFGSPLSWEPLDGKRASRISKTLQTGGYKDDESEWPVIQQAMIDSMKKLEAALNSHISNLPVQ